MGYGLRSMEMLLFSLMEIVTSKDLISGTIRLFGCEVPVRVNVVVVFHMLTVISHGDFATAVTVLFGVESLVVKLS